MNAINTYIVAVDSHITSRKAISTAQALFVTAYNKMNGVERGEARNAIAQLISKRTGVSCEVMSKGAYKGLLGFKSVRSGGTDKSEAARKLFEYYLPVVEKSSTTSVRKSADPVALLLKKFESMTAAQKRAFLKAVV